MMVGAISHWRNRLRRKSSANGASNINMFM